jgi:hypothetical protein
MKNIMLLHFEIYNRKRAENTKHIFSMLKTGGGPPDAESTDPLMKLVDAAAPNVDLFLDCDWDSTAAFGRSFIIN